MLKQSKLDHDIGESIKLRLSDAFSDLNIWSGGGYIQVRSLCNEIVECSLEVEDGILEVVICIPRVGYQNLHLHLSDPMCFDQVYEAMKAAIEEK